MNSTTTSNRSRSDMPVVAVTLGDAAGIGAELVVKLLAKPETTQLANVVLIGDYWLWEEGNRIAGTPLPETELISSLDNVRARSDTSRAAFLAMDTLEQETVVRSKAQPACGQSVLRILDRCMDAALAGSIDAICFAPLNKQAMKLGGMQHEDELHDFAAYLGVSGYFCEFNTLGDLWTSRISSHVPLKDVAGYLGVERIEQAAELIYRSLLRSGVPAPKIAIAAFNPHGGDGGLCGREEVEIIEPAVKALQARQWPTASPFHGPFPADTIFLKAVAGEYQAVVTMYHDQGQIAIKLLGFSRGVTVQGGLPIPITTPAHGTAFDIAGKGTANVEATWQAFQLACRMGGSARADALLAA
ncbi:4-hydroxythreonine-4-phosphate dehydrogenase PdxA [Bordetella holmesii CDC-H643-BH]|uniref:4-hydroxythreonine-4-phosphate dehydrogenase PdxA n=2 Tax=Bordetella holmesii TaxID=35814 RepID=A0A158MB29_9BORD|nr:4-hydroxythreonine-4-phosphate dehydrogenase [Bordetella holmesii F627]KAK88223.1 4-hydroxythreonine-4-phosphate dehydrogenase PdxA [Bordetella holmesii CDC-H572-BH]KAL00024.1 4-hydroxythreonine-4-phosphate dehydrogenase PdxA [Bordetella holmesii CDC-H585-BH]KCV03535.1 4-hydroxythreonine-4-phosphate dehydrogenase PdxA [Bordetella holmesii CDC-H629-BH]KCV11610.1 4-hydroxythreonine-4-phosphate dehydrogenase PdxA [Bordetella holmesii CDC-H785-BH]KCV17112.1 4-hydroxythreonine-4-phosphate dehydr